MMKNDPIATGKDPIATGKNANTPEKYEPISGHRDLEREPVPEKMDLPAKLSFHGEALAHEIDHQIGAEGNEQSKREGERRSESLGGEIERENRDGEAAQPDHGIGHHGSSSWPTDAMMQDDHDAAQYDGENRKIAARGRTDPKTQCDECHTSASRPASAHDAAVPKSIKQQR